MKRIYLTDHQLFTVAYEMAQSLKADLESCKRTKESIAQLEQYIDKNVEDENLLKQRLEDNKNFINRLESNIDEYVKIIEKMGFRVEQFF